MQIKISIDTPSDGEVVWIAIDQEDAVFVRIDRNYGFIKNLSIQISRKFLFEVGPCVNGLDQYPSFLISEVLENGTVTDRVFVRKLQGEWFVEHS